MREENKIRKIKKTKARCYHHIGVYRKIVLRKTINWKRVAWSSIRENDADYWFRARINVKPRNKLEFGEVVKNKCQTRKKILAARKL